MNDQTAGEMPWMGAAPAANEPPPAREPRQRRKKAEPAAPRKPRTQRAAAPEPAPKKPRKAREPKAERAAPETIKVTLKEFAAMRVGEESAKTFVKVHGLLSALGKGARTKVLAELSKVLG